MVKKRDLPKKEKSNLRKLYINWFILNRRKSILILTILLIFSVFSLFYQIYPNISTNIQKNTVFRSTNNSLPFSNLIIIILILASLVIIIQRSIKLYKVSKQR